MLHRSFRKHLLGVRMSTANKIVLAEFGRFPMQIHYWPQILRYHLQSSSVIHCDNSRLVKLAMVDGCALDANQSVTAATMATLCTHIYMYHFLSISHNSFLKTLLLTWRLL